MERKICFDRATLDNKIILDDDQYLVMPAVIASEIVHQYEDGWAYKPAKELEKMGKTASDIGVVPVKILKHPGDETHGLLLRQDDVHGRVENFQYVKNLIDPKTKRPCRKGVRGDIRWFKDRVPEAIIEQIKNATLRDVSIGFTFDNDPTSGDWNGTHYDYVQRNIFLNHVAAPLEKGRCPGPLCGIGFDSVFKPKIANDPFGEYENFEDCVAKNQHKDDPKAYCAEIKRKIEGEKTDKKHIGDISNCPICVEIEKTGLAESVKRLVKAYGKDIYYIVKGGEPPKEAEASTEDTLLEAKKAIESSRWFFEE